MGAGRKSSQALALRSRIVLGCAEGLSDKEVAARERVAQPTVGKWRRRFVEARCDGLVDDPRPGRPASVTAEQVEDVVVATLESIPANAMHWSRKSMAERKGCVLASPAFERIAQPTLSEDGRRAPALRFGDPRVQALAGALCTSVLAVTGITNKSLRALMTGLLGGIDYTMNRASYDLARLRVNGLITRVPGKNRYRLTRDVLRFAIFYTKIRDRLLRPLLAADQPPAPRSYEKPCTPSTFTSQKPSTTPAYSQRQPENSRQLSKT